MTEASVSSHFHTDFERRLVEEAVLLAMVGRPEENQFRRIRNPLYELADAEERERRFAEIHAEWFRRLKLHRPIQLALKEQPSLQAQTGCCRIASALSFKDEGADLYGAGPPGLESNPRKKTILVKLRPQSLLDASRLLVLLRHEFMHIVDILSPEFGYKPHFPRSEEGPAYDNLIRERYRVLWDTWIDGRLYRRGWAPQEIREKRLAEFAALFPGCRQETNRKFSRWFDSPSQTHSELLSAAQDPGVRPGLPGKPPSGSRCPLCHFPTIDFAADPAKLPLSTMGTIRRDFPHWQPGDGLCRQCADLYQTLK